MKKRRILNNKSIAILAFIFAIVGAVPDIWRNPTIFLLLSTAPWIIGGIYTWMNKKWAVALLGCLSIYDFFKDIIFEILKFKQSVAELSLSFDGFGQYVPYIIFLSMVIEVLFLFCFIYYGVIRFRSL